MLEDRDQLLIAQLTALCHKTSAVILSYYGQKERLDIQNKSNDTPITRADLAAHDILVDALPGIIDIPVISEESDQATHKQRHRDYWLIDPIDGTREFIEETGGFCIAIARIVDHRPVLGYIYAPTQSTFWVAFDGKGAYRGNGDAEIVAAGKVLNQLRPITCRTIHPPITIITAHRKLSKRMQAYLEQSFGDYQREIAGSALKFCAIADGKADIYPKISCTTSEWDIAAGDILLHEAGGGLRLPDGSLRQYGTSESTLNPPFIAYGAGLSQDDVAEYCRHLRHSIKTLTS